jgi:hypothetical protein
MDAALFGPQTKPRWRAVAIAAIVAAAADAAHDLTHQGTTSLACIVFVWAAIFAELAALDATFGLTLKRRLPSAWSFAAMLGVAAATSLASILLGRLVEQVLAIDIFGGGRPWTLRRTLEGAVVDGLLGLGLWAIAVVYPFVVRDANARALEAERLRTAAELAHLRAHLQPHFLLNTLNTVAGLVGEDPREARNLIGALGDLLRDALEETDEMQTIEDEVRWLRRYAEILETRHRGALTFQWEIDPATRGVRVPRLLLQPLVENAVKHGALRRSEGGCVALRTAIDPSDARRVTCVVEDNGPGPSSREPRPGALGLQLVTRRLALKYAGAATFRLESGEGRTRSIVLLPASSPS